MQTDSDGFAAASCRGEMNVLISVGEASGDMHAAAVILKSSALSPAVRFSGVAGKCMREAGCNALIPMHELNAMGIGDVITALPGILRAERVLLTWAEAVRPAAAVLVDFPGFHMRLGRKLRRLGIPVIQYIAPKLWSWGRWRVEKLKNSQDRMFSILPFEPEWFAHQGIDSCYAGNPSVTSCSGGWSRDELCRQYNLDKKALILGLLAGSRPGELKRHVPVLSEVLYRLRERFCGLQAIVPVAPGVDRSILAPMVDRGAILVDRTEIGFALPADAAVAVSGTATLELALWNVPTVLIYRSSPLHVFLGRRFSQVVHIGLVNIILDDQPVMPELIQEQCTVENIMREIVPILDGSGAASEQRSAFTKMRNLLGKADPAQEVAGQLLKMLA